MDTDIRERIGALAEKATAAHSRIDRLEVGLREDLKEIQKELKDLATDMSKSKGLTSAIVGGAGFLGAILSQVIVYFFTR